MIFNKKDKAQTTETAVVGKATDGVEALSASPTVGAPKSAPNELAPDEAKKRAIASKQMAAAFGEVVLLMSQTPTVHHLALRDLDWMVAPAIRFGQFAIAEAQSKTNGLVVPVAAVLWANVSEDVAMKLADPTADNVRLSPSEWKSGDHPWVIYALGEPKILAGLMEQLTKTVFKDRPAKMRARSKDGKINIGEIRVKDKAA
jgi:cytolysin-activating lysine-acyltransferase